MEKNIVLALCLMIVTSFAGCDAVEDTSLSPDPNYLDLELLRYAYSFATTDTGSGAWHSDFDLPTSLPNKGKDTEPATDILIYAGCETNPLTVAVASGKPYADPCESVLAVAVRREGNELHEVEASFNWYVDDADVLTLDFPSGPHTNFARIKGLTDIFDDSDAEEPQTLITVCARGKDAPKTEASWACATVDVADVVDLESRWFVTGVTFESETEIHPLQSGRRFEDHASGIKDGSIQGTSIQFGIDDYFYQGMFLDRNHMQGQVTELMGNSIMGSWQAERVDL